MLDFDLLLITPERAPRELLLAVEDALRVNDPERLAVLLRAPSLEAGACARLAHELRVLTREVGAKLLVHRDLELVQRVDADGVQLPERGPSVTDARRVLGAHACIGASRHERVGLQAAARDGASFATLSPVREVAGKGAPLGIAGFAAAARGAGLPVLALGGVDADIAPELVHAGAAGLAVIRTGLGSHAPRSEVQALLDAIDAGRASLPSAGR